MPVQSKAGLLSLLMSHQEQIRALGVRRLGLFGSFAREQQGLESDVDLLVEFERGQKTFDNFMRLAFLLEDILGRKVELLTPESISPYIRPHMMHEVEYVAFAA
jgi:predicted nucleotidyltransferase